MQLLLFGFAIEPGPLAAIAFRGLEDAAPLLVGVDRPLYACHGCSYSRSDVNGQVLVPGPGTPSFGAQPFSSDLTRLVSLAATVVRPSSRRVRLVGLCSSRCRRLVCWRTIFPVPVRRKRFEAPLWVLALGMFPLVLGSAVLVS